MHTSTSLWLPRAREDSNNSGITAHSALEVYFHACETGNAQLQAISCAATQELGTFQMSHFEIFGGRAKLLSLAPEYLHSLVRHITCKGGFCFVTVS